MPILSRLITEYPQADIPALKSFDVTTKSSGVMCVVTSLDRTFVYDSTSVLTADDKFIVQPSVGLGRWIRDDYGILKGDYTELSPFNKTVFGALNEENAYWNKVHKDISYFLIAPATQTLATSGAGDLAAKIATLVDGDILEIQTDASYSQITIPTSKRFAIRVKRGYHVQLNSAQAVLLSNNAANVFLSGFIFDSNPSGNHGQGSAVAFVHEAQVYDITFYNCTFRNNNHSAVLLAYHQSTGGDNYVTPNTLAEFSERVAFSNCHFFSAANEVNEGGAITARGIKHLLIDNCVFNGQDLARQIHLQNCIESIVIEPKVQKGGGGGNGEGIKFDKLGTPVGYKNSGLLIGGRIKDCIEGVDADDDAEVVAINTIVHGCSAEGFSVDDTGRATFINCISYNNVDGFRQEVGGIIELKGCNSFNNSSNNYRMDGGYTPDSSNISDSSQTFLSAINMPYDPTPIGFNSTLVQDAIEELKNYTDNVVGGSSISYFLSDTIDGVIAGYNKMFPQDTGEPESTVNGIITGIDILIKSFITEVGEPGGITLIKGIYEGHIHAAKTAGTNEALIYWKLFKRDSGGTETLLITSENTINLTGVNTSYNIHGSLLADINLLSTDRLVLKYYGTQTAVGTDPTITLYLEGANDSRIEIKTNTISLWKRISTVLQPFNPGDDVNIAPGNLDAKNLVALSGGDEAGFAPGYGYIKKAGTISAETIFLTIENNSASASMIGTETSIEILQRSFVAPAQPMGYMTWGTETNWDITPTKDGYFDFYLTRKGIKTKAYSIITDPVYISDHLFKIEGGLVINTNSATPIAIDNVHSANQINMICGTTILTVLAPCLIDQDLRIVNDPTWAGINSSSTGSVGANLNLLTLTNNSFVGADLTGTENSILWRQKDTTAVVRDLGRVTFGCENLFTGVASTQDSYCNIDVLENGGFINALSIASNRDITFKGNIIVPAGKIIDVVEIESATAGGGLLLNDSTTDPVYIGAGSGATLHVRAYIVSRDVQINLTGDTRVREGIFKIDRETGSGSATSFQQYESWIWPNAANTEIENTWKFATSASTNANAVREIVGTVAPWTTTLSTQNAYYKLQIAENGVLGDALSIAANKDITIYGALKLPAGLNIISGSGVPAISAPKGSLFLRTDGSAINNRAYININGSTTWTPLTTAV